MTTKTNQICPSGPRKASYLQGTRVESSFTTVNVEEVRVGEDEPPCLELVMVIHFGDKESSLEHLGRRNNCQLFLKEVLVAVHSQAAGDKNKVYTS